jgi:hypothetical protein
MFKPGHRTLEVAHTVISGDDAEAVRIWMVQPGMTHRRFVFIEKYTPRLKLDSDQRMVQAEANLRRALPEAKVLPNQGIKRVIPQSLMEVFGVWSWPTVTHHQDLRSAGRIALLGMAKDTQLNRVMAEVVRDHLEGRPWRVAHD